MSKKFWMKKKNEIKEVSLEEAFPFLKEEGKKILCVVGAGGKTTFIFTFADACAKAGKRTLVTTTTHMYEPTDGSFVVDIEERFLKNQYAVVGERASDGKIKGLKRETLLFYEKQADIVFIEADGAKRKPCKVPKETEPVIVPECQIVVGVIGLDAIGKPLSEGCFRTKEAKKLLKCSASHVITKEDIAMILCSYDGTRKGTAGKEYYVVLNKCDDEMRKKDAIWILETLAQCGCQKAVISRLL